MQTIDSRIDFNLWVGLKLSEFVRVQTEGGDVIDFRSSLSYLQNASPAGDQVGTRDVRGPPCHQRGVAPFLDVLR